MSVFVRRPTALHSSLGARLIAAWGAGPVLAEPYFCRYDRKYPGGFAMCSFMTKFLRAPRAEFMAVKLSFGENAVMWRGRWYMQGCRADRKTVGSALPPCTKSQQVFLAVHNAESGLQSHNRHGAHSFR